MKPPRFCPWGETAKQQEKKHLWVLGLCGQGVTFHVLHIRKEKLLCFAGSSCQAELDFTWFCKSKNPWCYPTQEEPYMSVGSLYIFFLKSAAFSVLAFCTHNLFLSGANASFHWAHWTFLLQQGLLQAKWWKCSVASGTCGWAQPLSSGDSYWECVTCMESFPLWSYYWR